jgi:hypothetical protein
VITIAVALFDAVEELDFAGPSLHLVARLHSEERAREVRRHIQYDPEPPV